MRTWVENSVNHYLVFIITLYYEPGTRHAFPGLFLAPDITPLSPSSSETYPLPQPAARGSKDSRREERERESPLSPTSARSWAVRGRGRGCPL